MGVSGETSPLPVLLTGRMGTLHPVTASGLIGQLWDLGTAESEGPYAGTTCVGRGLGSCCCPCHKDLQECFRKAEGHTEKRGPETSL